MTNPFEQGPYGGTPQWTPQPPQDQIPVYGAGQPVSDQVPVYGAAQPAPPYPPQPEPYPQPYPPAPPQPGYAVPQPYPQVQPGYPAPQLGMMPPPPGGYNPYSPGYGAPGEFLDLPNVGRFKLGGMGERLVARIIDWVVVGIPTGIILTAAANASSGDAVDDPAFALGRMSAFWFFAGLIALAYEVSMLASSGGTVGKKAMGLRVVTAQSAPWPGRGIGAGAAFARWATFTVPGFCCIWTILVSLSPLFDSNFRQGWHDKAAKTYVISTK